MHTDYPKFEAQYRYRCADCAAAIPRPEPGHTGGTGRAVFTGPDGTERSLCYPCADRRERETVASSRPGERFVGYIAGDGRHVTTWTGGTLMVIRRESQTRAGFGGSMVQYWARDPLGRQWYGRGSGRGMCIRLRLTKSRMR